MASHVMHVQCTCMLQCQIQQRHSGRASTLKHSDKVQCSVVSKPCVPITCTYMYMYYITYAYKLTLHGEARRSSSGRKSNRNGHHIPGGLDSRRGGTGSRTVWESSRGGAGQFGTGGFPEAMRLFWEFGFPEAMSLGEEEQDRSTDSKRLELLNYIPTERELHFIRHVLLLVGNYEGVVMNAW